MFDQTKSLLFHNELIKDGYCVCFRYITLLLLDEIILVAKWCLRRSDHTMLKIIVECEALEAAESFDKIKYRYVYTKMRQPYLYITIPS